ncbi:MAG: hypothetical protein L3J59_08955 [Methylococcaceae bacterium]|nr:hypothetical protein [Methylococcaceae bacterium]
MEITSLKKTNAIILIVASMSLALIGCGTDADSSSMSTDIGSISVQSVLTSMLK